MFLKSRGAVVELRWAPCARMAAHLARETLYPNFGRTAGPAVAAAVLSTGTLAWRTRYRRPHTFRLTAAAAGCLTAAHGIFWTVVQPVNVEMMRWPLDAIPQDWASRRDRWEYGHAVRAGLVTAALAALTWSLQPGCRDSAVRARTPGQIPLVRPATATSRVPRRPRWSGTARRPLPTGRRATSAARLSRSMAQPPRRLAA
jgi:hypothetical protein